MGNHPETIVPGVRAVEALLRHAPDRILEILYTGASHGARERVLQLAAAANVAVREATSARLEKAAGEIRHQGIIARATPASYAALDELLEMPQPLLLAVDQVTDPRNLGAMLRAAESLGATGAVLTKNRCARLGPTVAKTSAGASELIPVAMVTNLARAISDAQDQGLQVVGADMEGIHPEKVVWNQPTMLIIGAEGKGLRRLTRERCDVLVTIPCFGATESLNAATAAAILMYEAVRQRHPSGT